MTSSAGVCVQVVQALRDKPKAWHLGSAGALISQEREYKALHEVKNMKVGCCCFHSVSAIGLSAHSLHSLLGDLPTVNSVGNWHNLWQ